MTVSGSSPSPVPASTKVCIRCGLDCSKRPRTKDLQGRYTCRDCFDAAQDEQVIVMEPPAAKRSEHRIEPAPRSADEHDAALALEDEGGNDMYAMLLEGAAQAAAKVTSAPCPGCGLPLKSDAALCVSCGYNQRTGKAVTTKQGKAEVTAATPEDARALGRQRERELNAKAMRWEYIKPVIMTVVGLTITTMLLYNRGGGGNVEGVVGYLIVYGISIPVTVAAFVMCCSLWIGFDAPLKLVTLRMAGMHAILDILLFGVAFGGLGFGLYGGIGMRFILPLLIYTAMLMTLMEMDYEDALMAGVITAVLRFGGTIALLIWIARTFGG